MTYRYCPECPDGSPKMIIYSIMNLLDGKRYIGQTTTCFERRYGAGSSSKRWWKYVDNQYLVNAINKRGHENFKVEILEHGLHSTEQLDEREKYYIELFSTVSPNGYNYVSGGQSNREKWLPTHLCDKMALERRGGKPVLLLNNRTNEIVSILNVNRFSRENNLSCPTVTRVANGTCWCCKEWTLPHRPLPKFKMSCPKTGQVEIVLYREMASFCRQYGINHANLYSILAGNWKTDHGWTIEKVPIETENIKSTYIPSAEFCVKRKRPNRVSFSGGNK